MDQGMAKGQSGVGRIGTKRNDRTCSLCPGSNRAAMGSLRKPSWGWTPPHAAFFAPASAPGLPPVRAAVAAATSGGTSPRCRSPPSARKTLAAAAVASEAAPVRASPAWRAATSARSASWAALAAGLPPALEAPGPRYCK